MVIGARELRREGLGIDTAGQQRTVEYAFDFRDAVDRRVRTQQDDDRLAFACIGEHAVCSRERIGNARDERGVER